MIEKLPNKKLQTIDNFQKIFTHKQKWNMRKAKQD